MALERKLEAGQFVLLAEMEPPKGTDTTRMVSNALRVKGEIDACVVPEMSNAVMRMSALGAAMLLEGKGIETVMQVSCRDRNRLALQADLLAAAAYGIQNVMAVTGEDPSFGDHHEAKAVYDIDLPDLLDAIHTLQEGRDMAGIDLTGSPVFLVGSTVNAFAKGAALELELEEMGRKIQAGTRFFVTPPVFDIHAMGPFLDRMARRNVRIIPTVLLLKSLGMARYIARHMDHLPFPGDLITRIQDTPDKASACMEIARETIGAIKKDGLAGVLLSTIGWEHKLPELLQRL